MFRKTFFTLSIILALFLAVGIAHAVWGGEEDGNQHPMVGAMFADLDGSGDIAGFELICSGAYAGPSADGQHDVFLTAAHCLAPAPSFGIDQLYVSFDNEVMDADGPTGLIASEAFDWDPSFGHDRGDLHDTGVILLPAGSVQGIDPVLLPPEGYLDRLKAEGALRETDIDLVGYGVQPSWELPGGPRQFFDGIRRTAPGTIKALTQAWLLFNTNIHATDGGGGCYGDSGSPQFISGTTMIVSTTTGGDPICRAHAYFYRIDTPSAREFLGQYLTLP